MKRLPEILTLALCVLVLFPDLALAEGITEFAGPVDKVVNTLQGPVGKSISVLAIMLCGVGFWLNRGEDAAGIWKTLLGVVFVICLLSFADKIVGTLGFSFGGAIL